MLQKQLATTGTGENDHVSGQVLALLHRFKNDLFPNFIRQMMDDITHQPFSRLFLFDSAAFGLLLADGALIDKEKQTIAPIQAKRTLGLFTGSAGDGVRFKRKHVCFDAKNPSENTPVMFRIVERSNLFCGSTYSAQYHSLHIDKTLAGVALCPAS